MVGEKANVAKHHTPLPRRPCRQPVAPGGAQGRAREIRHRRDRRRGAERYRRPRDRARHQEAGRGRPEVGYRRRVPPLLVASRFSLGARRCRKTRHGRGCCLRRRHHAQRRRQGHRQTRRGAPSDDRAFQVRRGAHQADAEDHDSGAVGDLRPSDTHADRQERLPDDGSFFRRSRPGLQKSRARLRRRRLPLSATRRGFHRHVVR